MKKITLILIFCFSIFFSFAQNNKSIIPVISQTNDYVQLIENKYQQKVVHLEYDIINSTKESYRELFGGVQYGIILFGDEDIKTFKLDISLIENNNWKIVKSEYSDKGIVMIYFKPTKTDFYKFDFTTALDNPDDYSYYGFLIFR